MVTTAVLLALCASLLVLAAGALVLFDGGRRRAPVRVEVDRPRPRREDLPPPPRRC